MWTVFRLITYKTRTLKLVTVLSVSNIMSADIHRHVCLLIFQHSEKKNILISVYTVADTGRGTFLISDTARKYLWMSDILLLWSQPIFFIIMYLLTNWSNILEVISHWRRRAIVVRGSFKYLFAILNLQVLLLSAEVEFATFLLMWLEDIPSHKLYIVFRILMVHYWCHGYFVGTFSHVVC